MPISEATAGPPAGRLTGRQRLRGYRGMALLFIRMSYAYRTDFLFTAFGILLRVFLLRVVWTTVYPASGTAAAAGGAAVGLSTQIAYSTLTTVQYTLFSPDRLNMAPGRIRDGSIAFDLARPVGFNGQMFSAQLGATLGVAPFALLALPLAVLAGGAQAPATPWAGAAYALSLVPAYLIAMLLGALLGMAAFWTLEINGVQLIYAMVSEFLAGALVPLWFMPGWLRGLAQWLPFQGTTYTPVALYLGRIRGTADVLGALGLQTAWVLLLVGVLRLVWSRALRRVTIQGG